ncbi:hypothetical protein DDT52_00670 [Brenneria roseae subsp. roseae]|nr:hypothetical protein DDT52_00670 [Brenneria roseae subsp. roseae]
MTVDFIILSVVSLICLKLIINGIKKNKHNRNSLFYYIIAIAISCAELSNAIYIPYSYNHNRLYDGNPEFYYDYMYITLWVVILITSMFLLINFIFKYKKINK